MNDGRFPEPGESRLINVKFIVGVVLAGLVVLFLIQNVGVIEVRFLVWSFFVSRALLLFLVLVLGVIVGWFGHSLSVHRRRRDEVRSGL